MKQIVFYNLKMVLLGENHFLFLKCLFLGHEILLFSAKYKHL